MILQFYVTHSLTWTFVLLVFFPTTNWKFFVESNRYMKYRLPNKPVSIYYTILIASLKVWTKKYLCYTALYFLDFTILNLDTTIFS